MYVMLCIPAHIHATLNDRNYLSSQCYDKQQHYNTLEARN